MIVRDAADFVTETLDSVIDHVDDWLIVDTGSVDDTPTVITEYFAARGPSGELVHRPWVGFAHNRTEALALCHGRADYAFMIDADDLVSGRLNLDGLSEPGYRVRFGPNFVYWRPAFFKLDREWEFRGVVHEYAVATDGSHTVNLEGDYHFTFRSLGGRGKDPAKFQRDVDALMGEFDRDPNDARTAFYLGQSHRDLGDRTQRRRTSLRQLANAIGQLGFDVHVHEHVAGHQTTTENEILLHRATTAVALVTREVEQCADEQRHESAAGDGGDDAHGLARGHRSVETLQVAHVVVGHEQIHEATQCTLIVEQAIVEAGMGRIQIGQHLTKRGALDGHRRVASGQRTKSGGDAHGDGHGRNPTERVGNIPTVR
jgi:hypothetical protein